MDEKKDAILQTLASIPAGKVCSYGELAKRAGYPGYARYVGHILKNLPERTNIPWHRVINSQGKISFPENSDKFREQKQRLQSEGIIFKENRCSLKKYAIT